MVMVLHDGLPVGEEIGFPLREEEHVARERGAADRLGAVVPRALRAAEEDPPQLPLVGGGDDPGARTRGKVLGSGEGVEPVRIDDERELARELALDLR